MQLTPAQLAQFERDGYLFFPSLFTPQEIQALLDEVPRLYAQYRPENVREKGSDAVRTINGAPITATVRMPEARGRALAFVSRVARRAIHT